MGQITLSLPQTGLPNSTEDVKVTNDLTLIQTLVNGNIDTNNLAAAAGITFAQLAAGAGRPNIVGITGNTTAASGNLYVVNSGNPLTITLPAPTQNALIGIFPFAATGAAPVTVTSPTNVIGLGLLASSFVLGASSSCVVLMGNSTTNWVMVSGQQDTGWVAPASMGANTFAGTIFVRKRGDSVTFRGAFAATALIAAGATIMTLPAGFAPATTAVAMATSSFPTAPTSTAVQFGVGSATVTTAQSIANGNTFLADGLNYTPSA